MKIECLTLGPLNTNCYIIYDDNSKEAIVVDPASDINTILSKLNELSLKVKYIVLTHAHSDHICALDALCDATDAKVCIGRGDDLALSDGMLNLCMYFGVESPMHKANILLDDNDTIGVDGFNMTVISTPGHTPGSIALYSGNVLISGDTLFYESVGRTDFPKGSTNDLMNSIKNKLYILDPSTVVYPGHGNETTIEHEIDNNPFVW